MIFCFPLPYFALSQQVLYFLLSTLVLTLYIDVVLSLSIDGLLQDCSISSALATTLSDIVSLNFKVYLCLDP